MRILNTCVKAYIWTVTALILTFSHSAPVLGPADDSIGATLIPKYGTGSLTPSDSLDEVDNILRDGIRAWGLEADGGPKAPPIIEPIEKRPPSKPKVSSTPKKPGAGDKPRKGKSRNHGSKPNAQDPKHDPLDDDFDDDDDLWDGPIDEDEFVKTSFWIKDSFEIRCADPKHIFKSPIAVERTKGLLPEDFSWRNFDDTPWMAEQFIREMQESCIENCGCDDWASLHAPEARKNDGLSYCQTIKDARKCEWVFGCQCWAELGDPEIPEKFENMTVQNWASELSSLPMNLRKAHPNWRWNNGPKGWNNQSLGTGFGPRTEYWETRNYWFYPRPWDVYGERIMAEVQPGYYLYGPDVPYIHGNPMKDLRTWRPSLRGEWELFMRYIYEVNPDRTYRPSRIVPPPDPFPPLPPLFAPDPELNGIAFEENLRKRYDPPSGLTTPEESSPACMPRYLALSNMDGIERLCPPTATENIERNGGEDSSSSMP